MKKLFLSLVLAGTMAYANAQTEVSLSDFNSKAESLSGQQVKVSGYLVEIGKDGKTAMISSSATASKPQQGQGKPDGKIVRVTSTSEISTSLKGQSVTVTGTVAEEKAPMNNGNGKGKGNVSDTTKRPTPPNGGKGKGNVSDTIGRPTPPNGGKGGKHNNYTITNATITKN